MQIASGDPTLTYSDAWKKNVPTRSARKLIGSMTRGDTNKRQSNTKRIQHKLSTLSRRVAIRRAFLAFFLAIPLLLAGFFSYRALILLPRMKEFHAEEKKKTADLGLATDIESFNKKYPVTRQGELAILEAKRIFAALTALDEVPFIDTSVSTEQAREGIYSKLSIGQSQRERLSRFADAAGFATGDRLDFEALFPYVEKNRAALDQLIALSNKVPYQELNWYRSYDKAPPFPFKSRRLGSAAAEGESHLFLKMRTLYQTYFPAAIYRALADNDQERAYHILTAALFLGKVLESQGSTLVAEMIGVALVGLCQESALALVRNFPPDQESAMRLFRIIDPKMDEMEFIRGFESEILFTLALMEYFRREHKSPPRISGGMGDISDFFNTELGLRGIDWLMRPEQHEASALLYMTLQMAGQSIIARSDSTLPDLDSFESRIDGNIYASMIIPGFLRCASTCRAKMATSSLLRSELLLQVERMEKGSDLSFMPKDLKTLFESRGFEPPLDYLGENPTSLIQYTPNSETGSYLLSHTHEEKGEKPVQFKGRWAPVDNTEEN